MNFSCVPCTIRLCLSISFLDAIASLYLGIVRPSVSFWLFTVTERSICISNCKSWCNNCSLIMVRSQEYLEYLIAWYGAKIVFCNSELSIWC